MAADLLVGVMARQLDAYPTAQLSRCPECGQWSWGGVCTLHPEAAHDAY